MLLTPTQCEGRCCDNCVTNGVGADDLSALMQHVGTEPGSKDGPLPWGLRPKPVSQRHVCSDQ